MLLAVLLQSACLPTCHINVNLTKHLPVEDLLSVLKAAGGMLLHSLSPSLSLTRNHLKLYWLWFASSALFPPVLCLCLSSIITTVLCSGSFCLISLPSIALIFFLFPLIVVCFITSMLPLISFYFFAPLNIDWGQRSQRLKCLNQVYREAYISLFLSPGSFKGVQQFCFLFVLLTFKNSSLVSLKICILLFPLCQRKSFDSASPKCGAAMRMAMVQMTLKTLNPTRKRRSMTDAANCHCSARLSCLSCSFTRSTKNCTSASRACNCRLTAVDCVRLPGGTASTPLGPEDVSRSRVAWVSSWVFWWGRVGPPLSTLAPSAPSP